MKATSLMQRAGLGLTAAMLGVAVLPGAPAIAQTASANPAPAKVCVPTKNYFKFTSTQTKWIGVGKVFTSGPGPGDAWAKAQVGVGAKGTISVSGGAGLNASVKKVLELNFEAKVDVSLELSATFNVEESARFAIPKRKYVKIQYKVKTKQANWTRYTSYDSCRDKKTGTGFTRMIVKPLDSGWIVRRVNKP